MAGAVAVLGRADGGQGAPDGAPAAPAARASAAAPRRRSSRSPSACDDAGGRGQRLGRADHRVLEPPAPAVACARHRRTDPMLRSRAMPDEPALLARGPWAPRRGRGPLERRPLRRPARARGGRRRRHRRAARPRLAQPRRPRRRGSSATREHDGKLTMRAAAHALGAAPRRGRRVAVGRRAVRHPRPPTGAGWPGAARRGCRSWAGRWALGAGGAVDVGESPVAHAHARARRGVVGRPRARARRGARAPAAPARDVRRPGLAARGRRRSRPTTSTTPTPGGRPTSTTGRPRPTSRCAAWPACWPDA